MRKSGLLFAILFAGIACAQQVSDYKYIQVPERFSDFDTNQFGLNNYLTLLLERKNYEILPGDEMKWPQAAADNPCSVLRADVKKEKSIFRNIIKLTFTDCNNREIKSIEGISRIKDFHRGNQEALRLAAAEILNSAPKEHPVQNNENQIETNFPVRTQNNTAPISSGFEFRNEQMTIRAETKEHGEILLFNKENSEHIATLFTTSRKGVYRAEIQNNDTTTEAIAFYDGVSIEIEMPDGENLKFTKINES